MNKGVKKYKKGRKEWNPSVKWITLMITHPTFEIAIEIFYVYKKFLANSTNMNTEKPTMEAATVLYFLWMVEKM